MPQAVLLLEIKLGESGDLVNSRGADEERALSSIRYSPYASLVSESTALILIGPRGGICFRHA
jgi:hypothetical protein